MHQTNFFVKSMFGKNRFFYTKNASKNDLKKAFCQGIMMEATRRAEEAERKDLIGSMMFMMVSALYAYLSFQLCHLEKMV